jgi:voltage-gated potassium channel
MVFLLGCSLILLTLLMQTVGVTPIIEWLRRVVRRHYAGPFDAGLLVLRTAIALLVLHGLTILLWAACYRWLCFPSLTSAFYFSGSTYSTVGYGDVVLPSQWRLLSPMESIVGVLMCGLSVSILFALIQTLVTGEQAAPAGKTPGRIPKARSSNGSAG